LTCEKAGRNILEFSQHVTRQQAQEEEGIRGWSRT